MHFGKPEEIEMQEWWEAPIVVLQNNLRRNVRKEQKEDLIRLAMGVGAIEYDESKISEY